MCRWQPAYIAVGSNLDDPRAQVLRACAALGNIPTTRLVRRSPLYRSPPLGPRDQPDFVNAVAGLLTQLAPRPLWQHLQAIERDFGRPAQHARWGPRVIDLDLIAVGREILASADLTVPHPGVVSRSFVLYPLADIAVDLELPGLGRVGELKARLAPDGLEALPDMGD